MTHGSPDWVRIVQVAVIIDNQPVAPTTLEESVFDGFGSKSTSSSSYQTVSSWTVSTGKIGKLYKIELACDDYDTALWRVTVAGTKVLDGDSIPSELSKDFGELTLDAGDQVLIEVKSDGSTTIEAYADIDGKEVG